MILRDYKIINIGIAEIKLGKSPYVLRTTLGSCLGVVLYQPDRKVGGIAHIMLAKDSLGRDKLKNPGKYAETALPKLLEMMAAEGCQLGSYSARIFGGASMFKNLSSSFLQHIGEDNIQYVKQFLQEKKIPILVDDTGGHEGRTISLYLEDGRILLKKAGMEKFLYRVR
ncbi:MAG: chemotaxis protein CheD [Spirochaetota bacterium]